MCALGQDLDDRAEVVLIGPVDPDVRGELEAADRAGHVRWLGSMPNGEAMETVEGSLVGLCLLAPLPNYVVSMPTKVYEYLAHGVPAVVSPLPLAREAVERSGAGCVVEPGDRRSVEAAVRAYLDDPARRRLEGTVGHDWVLAHHDWRRDGDEFVATLRGWAAPSSRPRRVRR
jgi:glycosyltransferase involved in cell wall biosynthesis